MDLEKIALTINSLKQELKQLENEYYAGKSKVEDEIYDYKLRTLVALENEYPQFKTEDSPSQRVGFSIDMEGGKVSHDVPMLSLNNAFNNEELSIFFESCEKNIGNIQYILEPKVDGASISLIYENGCLVKAISRGDGEIGEDLTHKVLKINSVPKYIKGLPPKIIFRGEVYIRKNDFRELQHDEENNKTFANHRNFVSGSLRLKDINNIAKKNLKILCYSIPKAKEEYGIGTQHECIQKMEEWGIETHDSRYVLVSEDKQKILEFIKKFEEVKKTSDIPYDGLVIKVNDLALLEDIGSTSKFPKWAIAYKYPALVKESKLLEIIPTVGRTGKITYSARIEGVELDGSVVQYATLHNASYIKDLDLRIGDYVSVYKSGEIVPKIIGFSRERREEGLEVWEESTHCPSCKTELVIKENLSTQYCTNEDCEEKRYAQLSHFTSKEAVDIEGLSTSIIIKLFKLGIVKTIPDIYRIENHKEEIINSDSKIKDKLFHKLVQAIEKSKDKELYKVLFGLGINFIGKEVAYLICRRFPTIDLLSNAPLEKIMEINGVGKKSAESLFSWFREEKNMLQINELKEIGLFKDRYEQKYEFTESFLKGKKVVITGKLSIPREEFAEILQNKYEAIVSSSITKKTDYLIFGENSGSKLEKAKSLNVEIISEKELLEKLNQ